MNQQLVILPGEETDFVELARTPSGRVFRKKILHMDDDFVYPGVAGGKVHVDQQFAESLVRNFKDKVCDIVQVPVVDDKNAHSEDPLRNIGEVIDLDYQDDGVYVTLDARNEKAADALGKTLLGASAMLSMNYTDTKTGKKVGPTLLHTAITNRPYLTDLGGFEELVSLSADSGDEEPVLLTHAVAEPDAPEDEMTKDEMIAALKADHGIDVDALLNASPTSVDSVDLSNALGELGVVTLSAGQSELSLDEIAEGVVALSDKLNEAVSENEELEKEKGELSARVAELESAQVEAEVDALIEQGKILPAKRDAMVKLANTDRELFDDLIPEGAVVSLSEDGVQTHDAPDSEAEATIKRLAEKANEI